MVLVDTSVWIDHFRSGDADLASLLEDQLAAIHTFVLGELALGNLPDRAQVLQDLSRLPAVPVATHREVMRFIERTGLAGRGVGYVDAHLIASAVLSGALVWTRDSRLRAAASSLNVAHPG